MIHRIYPNDLKIKDTTETKITELLLLLIIRKTKTLLIAHIIFPYEIPLYLIILSHGEWTCILTGDLCDLTSTMAAKHENKHFSMEGNLKISFLLFISSIKKLATMFE